MGLSSRDLGDRVGDRFEIPLIDWEDLLGSLGTNVIVLMDQLKIRGTDTLWILWSDVGTKNEDQ